MQGTRKTLTPPPPENAAPSSAPRKGKAPKSYAAALLHLFAAFTTLVTDAVRAFLLARLSVAKARSLGLRASPSDVVDEFARCLAAYAPAIQQKRLPGYGPMRARFGLELAQDVVVALDHYASMNPALRGAAAERDRAMELTEAMRADVVAGLRNLAGDDADAVGRVRAVAEPQSAADEHLRAMGRLAQEVAHAREEVPAELLDDAGLTPEALDAMQETTRGAAEARTSSRARRLAQQKLRADLAEPCGRILHELQVMLRAARTARRRDRTTPVVSSWLVTRPAGKPQPKDPAAPKPPAPAKPDSNG